MKKQLSGVFALVGMDDPDNENCQLWQTALRRKRAVITAIEIPPEKAKRTYGMSQRRIDE